MGALEADYAARYWANAVQCFEETGTFVYPWDAFRIDDGWLYARVPDGPPDEVEARRARYTAHGEAFLDLGTDHWEAEVRPEVEERLTRMRRTRPRSESLASLARHVEICMDEAARILGYLHWAMVGGWSGLRWPEVFAEVTGRPEVEAAEYLQGLPHETDRLVRRLRRVARLYRDGDPSFDTAFAAPVATYGRRNGSGYGSATTFASPTWSMDPSLAMGLVRDYARTDIDGAEHRDRAWRRHRRRRFASLRRQYAVDPAVLARLDRAYEAGARQIRAVEDHNHLMEQEATGTLREAIARIGRALVDAGRVDKPTDALSLSLAELHALRDMPDDLRPLVADRKAERARRGANPPPSNYGPQPTAPAFDIASRPEETSTEAGLLIGVAASPGVATGRAVVATDTQAPPEIEPGDVLVARDAGPAWTPVFPLLAALVLDAGANFQHAALVAREFGIPAVIGTGTGTRDIASGSTITVDGSAGRVQLEVQAGA